MAVMIPDAISTGLQDAVSIRGTDWGGRTLWRLPDKEGLYRQVARTGKGLRPGPGHELVQIHDRLAEVIRWRSKEQELIDAIYGPSRESDA